MSPALHEIFQDGKWKVKTPIPEGTVIPDLVTAGRMTASVSGTKTGFDLEYLGLGVVLNFFYYRCLSFPEMRIINLPDRTRIRAVESLEEKH